MSSDRNARALAGLRIAVGVLFLIFAEYKIFGAEFTRGGGFQFWIHRFLAEGTYSVLLLCFATFAFANADQAFALLPAKAAWGKSVLPFPKLLSS